MQFLLEDYDNMHQLDLFTFSRSRLIQLRYILHDIHETGVLHGDISMSNYLASDIANKRSYG